MRTMPPSAYKLIAVTVTGSKRFTSEEIALASGLPVGTVAHEEDFKKAARQLGETGAFSDVSYSYTYSGPGTKLEFKVTDAEKFVPVNFTDFVWFTDEDLLKKVKERIPLFKGELPTNGRLLGQVSDVLQAVLVENAVPGTVEYIVHEDAKSQSINSINYRVSGISIRIRHVEFSGAAAAELPQLQIAAEKLLDREYARDVVEAFITYGMLPVYHAHGYLKASSPLPQLKVAKSQTEEANGATIKPTFVDLKFAVTPGIQYKVRHWEWSGNKEISTDALQPLLHVQAGQIANTVQLEKDLHAAQELYGSRGYVTATIKAKAEFDDAAGAVAYRLAVNEGSLYHMGELEFRGIDNNLTARLRAAWRLRQGEVYDASYLKEFLPKAQKLLPPTMDWEVTPHVTALSRDKTVDVDLQYTAKAPQ
jgi:outer membrane protein assembly factor BamA